MEPGESRPRLSLMSTPARRASIVSTAAVALLVTTAFEWCKSLVFPQWRPWGSHAATIFFCTSLASVAGLIFHRRQQEYSSLLQEEKAVTEAMIRNLPGMAFVFDAAGELLHWNARCETLFGYSAAEVAKMRALDFAAPEDRSRLAQHVERVLTEGSSETEAHWLAKGGARIPCYLTGVRIWRQGRPCIICIGIDLTQSKQAEKANYQLAALVMSTVNAVIGKTADGVIVSWNPAAEAMFGYTAEEAIGKHIFLLIPPEKQDEGLAVLKKVMSGEQLPYFDSVCRRKDGSRFDVSLSVSPIIDPAGHVLGISTIAVDVSERKRNEHELRKAKEAAEAASRAKSEFLANVSHELRTPMNGILGMAELALATGLTEEQREYLLLLKASGERLLRAINDVLDFSKMEANKLVLDPVVFNLHDRVSETLRLLQLRAQQKGLELHAAIEPALPPWVVGDPERLTQVLVNLVGNALKFTDHGEIRVHAACRHAGPEELEVLVRVSDTGIGIPAGKLRAIFQAFVQADGSTTRKYGGTGLGLPIANRLVSLMGGRLWVDSVPGRGSTFSFTARLGLVQPSSANLEDVPANRGAPDAVVPPGAVLSPTPNGCPDPA